MQIGTHPLGAADDPQWNVDDESLGLYRFSYTLSSGHVEIDPGFYDDYKVILSDPSIRLQPTVWLHPEDHDKLRSLENQTGLEKYCIKVRLRIPEDIYRTYPLVIYSHEGGYSNTGRIEGVVCSMKSYWHLQNQAMRLEKATGIARMISGAIHDIKNQLSIIQNSLSMLDDTAEPRSAKILQIARQSAAEAVALSRCMLDYTREEPLRYCRLDLNDLLADTVQKISYLMGAQYKLVVRTCDEPCIICGNPVMLCSSIINLVINARDAMPRGGTLTMIVERKDANPYWRGSCDRTWIVLSVQDTGAGMSPEVIRKACEPFFTTKSPEQGTGLGLWVCQHTMNNHGGTLAIDSRIDGGTRVEMAFPEYDPAVAFSFLK